MIKSLYFVMMYKYHGVDGWTLWYVDEISWYCCDIWLNYTVKGIVILESEENKYVNDIKPNLYGDGNKHSQEKLFNIDNQIR